MTMGMGMAKRRGMARRKRRAQKAMKKHQMVSRKAFHEEGGYLQGEFREGISRPSEWIAFFFLEEPVLSGNSAA